MPLRPADADEHLHEPGAGADWSEAYGFEFAPIDGALAGFVVMTVHPHARRSWCWSAIAGRDRAVCMVDEPEAPLPRRAAMELRAPALWVDVEIEVPFVHATVGMEAFGLTFDDPDEALRTGRGARTPFGLDLEWESDDAPVELGVGSTGSCYELQCRVTGEVLLGPERHEIDCPGRRWHRWGTPAWWDASPATGHPASTWVATRVPMSGPPVVEISATLDGNGWTMARRFGAGAAEKGT